MTVRPTTVLVVAYFLLQHGLAVLAAKDPCRKHETKLDCKDASCAWKATKDGHECVTPNETAAGEVTAVPPPKEGKNDCTNPSSCQDNEDCCFGFVCSDVDTGVSESSKKKSKKNQSVKQCTIPQPPPSAMDCPPVGSSIDLVGGKYRLRNNDNLCTLSMVSTDKKGNVSALVPLARSYMGNDWEVAAGSYAAENVFKDRTIPCTSGGVCSIQLPTLSNKRAAYRLSSYRHGLTEVERRARFLEMTTFGTTPQDLSASWGFDNEAEWVQNQMQLPLSSHREYFRKRANPRWTFSQEAGRSDHPCDEFSRWRRFTFTRKDKYRIDGAASGYLYVQNTTYTANANGLDIPQGPFILYVDGHARTVVETWRWTMDAVQQRFPVWDSNFAYQMCSSVDEWTGGRVFLRTKPYQGNPNGVCREAGVNAPINFVGYQDLMGPYVLNLPSDIPLTPIDRWRDGGAKRNDDQYILRGGLRDSATCSAIPTQAEDFSRPVFGMHPTEGVLQWDPRLVLEENTPESPLEDGGGKTEKETNGKTFCSNVPRTFLNFDDCVFSNETSACGVTGAPDAAVELDSNNLLQLHSLTGRYVYAIHGLKVKQEEFDYEVPHPCTPGLRSRWEREAGTTCDNPTGLGPDTRRMLRRLIAVSSDNNPFVRDITFPRGPGAECNGGDTRVEIEIQVGTDCWKHVHPEHLSVWDLTYWTRNNTHPGNAPATSGRRPNPIKKWLDGGLPVLIYPSSHPMDDSLNHDMSRWDANFGKFEYVGRFGDTLSYRDLPSNLQTQAVAEFYGASTGVAGTGVMVCGSPGEVANDNIQGDQFDLASNFFRDSTPRSVLSRQREVVWTMVALYGQDQLRQRMAWALSQILVVAKSSISLEGKDTEVFLQFHDIFVRNAFGNYFDVLREISYSPLMAENLSFLNSRSSAYVWERFVRVEFADENFAREIMQLFSTGLIMLNMDGTPKLDENSNTQQVYTNADIRSFSRAWTGFTHQRPRGNYEDIDNMNRLDPMAIIPEWRDRFPKTDLYGGYIGDQYPLCVDLPSKQFLRKGATYRLLGRSPLPDLQTDRAQYTERFVLDRASSALFAELCNDSGSGCRFRNQVTLNRNLGCRGLECGVDTLRVVEVISGMFYEYVQPPCVQHPFYDNAIKLNKASNRRPPICGDPKLPVATSACCEEPDSWTEAVSYNFYHVERMTFATQEARCRALGLSSCEYDIVDRNGEYWETDIYHWAYSPCTIQVKVNPEGEATIVHNVSVVGDNKVLHINDDNRNYFGVAWDNGLYPQKTEGNCGVCETVEGGNCLCETSVREKVVFTSNPPNVEAVLSALQIGAPDPSSFNGDTYSSTSVNGFIVHKRGSSFSRDTIFEVVEKSTGRTLFLKNAESTVFLESSKGERSDFSFRNPVHFMSLIPTETNTRDAVYETEATLKHYFYHQNTAPFLCIRFIQRFGISNASPRFVKSCAYAFRQGTYEADGITFGTGKYGDLAATVASILLDREARSVVLDADPASGSIREPLIRVIGLMRNMNFEMRNGGKRGETPLAVFRDLDQYIGQMAYEYLSVFSFFLPEFQPDGPILRASLVAPEAQLLDMPKTIDLINGLHSMIKYGFSHCYFDLRTRRQFGFGHVPDPVVGFGDCRDNGRYSRATGLLTYQPVGETSEEVVDELATLLTAGRLSKESRKLIVAAFDEAVAEGSAGAGLRVAQQLITTTPEFHTTNVVKFSGETLPDVLPPPLSDRQYKAIVFLMFAGGCDSFNMLVPNECQKKLKNRDVDAYTHYAETRNPAHLMQEDLLPIDASGQANCETFGVHEDLPIVQELYDDGDLLFFANTGVLGKPSSKSSYKKNTPTQLFAHNTMQFETRAVDLFDRSAGIGVLGRLTDALGNYGISTGSVSLDTSSSILEGVPGKSSPPYVVSQHGIRPFMPQDAATMTRAEMLESMYNLNNATTVDSGFMAKTWSSSLVRSLYQNQELHAALEGTEVSTDFGDTDLGRKFEIVAKMIKTRQTRGSDTDVFYVELGGFDTHANVEESLQERFKIVNSGVSSLVTELKTMGLWDNTVIVQSSEFARTLSPNSGAGTDHAWGGNYFMCGGSVKGGQILGTYPTDMSETSEINVGRGRLIPTTAWDQIWPAIAQWTGVTKAQDFDEICPGRRYFDSLFLAGDLFNVPRDEIPTPMPLPGGEEGTPQPGESPSESPPGETPSSDESKSEPMFAMAASYAVFLSWIVVLLVNWI